MGGPFDLARDRRAGGLARAAEMDGLPAGMPALQTWA